MDFRTDFSVSAQHQCHQSSVLTVAASEHYIYSGSEDKTLCVWDRRAQNMLQKIPVSSVPNSILR